MLKIIDLKTSFEVNSKGFWLFTDQESGDTKFCVDMGDITHMVNELIVIDGKLYRRGANVGGLYVPEKKEFINPKIELEKYLVDRIPVKDNREAILLCAMYNTVPMLHRKVA